MSRFVFGLSFLLATPALATPILLDELGTGLDLRVAGQPDAREICVDGSVNTTSIRSLDFRFVEVFGILELETELSQTMGADLAGKLTASSEFSGNFELDASRSYTAFVLELNTVARNFALMDDDDLNRTCDADIPTDYQKFLHACGTHWLQSEKLGGYIVVLVESTELTTLLEADYEMEGSLPLTEQIGLNTNAAGRLFQQLQYGSLDATVSLVGLPALGFGSANADGIIGLDSSDVNAYVQQLFNDLDAGLNGPDRDTRLAAYGVPLHQNLQSSRGLMLSCGVELPDEVSEGLQCADEAFAAFDRSQKSELDKPGRELLNPPTLERVLAEEARWDWGEEPEENQRRHQEASDHIATCKNDVIPPIADACARAYTDGQYADLCAICAIPTEADLPDSPTGCTELELDALARDLDDVTRYAPDAPGLVAHHVDQGADEAIGDLDQQVCLLTGVQGAFAGGGEKVLLEPSNGYWRLEVQSRRKEMSERLRARASCVDKDAFIDLGGRPKWLDESANHGPEGTIFPGKKYGLALAGVQGKLDGMGDKAKVDPGALQGAAIRQGSVSHAWGTSFGVDHPRGGEAEVRAPQSITSNTHPDRAVNRITLSRSSDAVCYLTSVSGDFDGGGEWARVVREGINWELQVGAACVDQAGFFGTGECLERKEVQASAACMDFDQD